MIVNIANSHNNPHPVFAAVPMNSCQFGPRTIVFGPNGTGKTTLARALQADEEMQAGQLTPQWDGKAMSTFVFNEHFVKTNLLQFVEEGGSAPSIAIGKKSIEHKQRKIEIAIKLDELNIVKNSHAVALQKCDPAIIETQAKKNVVDRLGKYNSGQFHSSAYKRGRQLRKKIVESQSENLSDSEFAKCMSIIDKDRPGKVPETPIPPNIELIKENLEDASAILSVQIPKPDNVKFSELPGFGSWAEKGISLSEETHGLCPFCAQDMDLVRYQEIVNTYVNDNRNEYRAKLNDVRGRISNATSGIADYNRHTQGLVAEDSEIERKLRTIIEELRVNLDALEAIAVNCMKCVDAKMEELESQIEFSIDDVPLGIESLISNLAAVLSDYEDLVKGFETQSREAIRKLERSILAGFSNEFISAVSETEEIRLEAESLEESVSALNDELAEILADEASTIEMAREINGGIVAIFGRGEFEISPSSDGLEYTLRRADGPARFLSEGEKQVVCLLYFLASLNSKDVELSESVVVIDDPVTGLDRGNHRAMFDYILSKSESWPQMIVVTHDFTFFSNFLKEFNSDSKISKFGDPVGLLLNRTWDEDVDRNVTCIYPAPGYLMNNSSEYFYLFDLCVKAALDELPGRSLSVVGNSGRRLLESFASYHLPRSSNFTHSIYTMWDRVDWQSRLKVKGALRRSNRDISTSTRYFASTLIRKFHGSSHNESVTPMEGLITPLRKEDFARLLFFMSVVDSSHFSELVDLIDDNGKQKLRRVMDETKGFLGEIKKIASSV